MKKITIIFITLLIILCLPITLLAAQKRITAYTWDRNILVLPKSTSFGQEDPTTFPPIVNDPSTTTTSAIVIDPATGAIILGNSVGSGSGAIWYGGTSPAGTCNPCTNGVCRFGLGFRAYFEFRVTTPDSASTYGDGFNFTIINSTNNRISYRGGAPNAAVDMGELNGYAGPGNTATTSATPHATPPALDGLGLQPPKMALEFDTYANTGAMSNNGCSGGRADTANNHVALMFWGTNPASTTMCTPALTSGFPQASFDDNIHGAGAGTTTNPYNSASTGNGSGLGGYYERARGTSTYNWMEDDTVHRVRIEAFRTSASQTYQVKAWVDCEAYASPYGACSAAEYVIFKDVSKPYDNSSYLPKIDRTQILSTADNIAYFNNILFGFTVGTGGATERIELNNIAFYFPPSIVGTPSNLSFTPGGGSGTVSVTAVTGCPWTTSNNGNTWITVTPASNTGTEAAQTANYTVAANAGAARTGTMTIAGQTFTVTQTGCTYTVGTPSNLSFTASGGSGTGSVTATIGCPWTTSNNGYSWITVNPASSTGTGAAQTVNYTVAANNTGIARTGTMTIAGQTFTVTQTGCTLTIAANSFACKSAGSSRVYIKVYLTDGAGNPVTDATSVTYSVSGSGGSGTLANSGGGYYGGTQTSTCGALYGSTANCARTASISSPRTVTVVATRAGCNGSPLTVTMTVPYP